MKINVEHIFYTSLQYSFMENRIMIGVVYGL